MALRIPKPGETLSPEDLFPPGSICVDAVVNAPVTERHRCEAVSVLYPETEHGFKLPASLKHWIVDGFWRGSTYLSVEAVAQSLANLEAAVRREYSKLEQHHATLLEAAQHVVESDNADRIATIFLLKHTLETMKNA